ncbi:MAG: glycosyltransferase family 39 protein, partial [Actinomycetota bacterium]
MTTTASGAARTRPSWVLPALVVVVVVAALLFTWNIGYSGLSTYYAASARSMSRSLHAFLFGALDPAATTTLDKLSGFLVPQAVLVMIFGFHAWVLALPQAIEGVITVIAAYLIGSRWRGWGMGLATAAVMALTPMLAAMFGKPMEDGMLTMTMVLAFLAWQRAVLSKHWAWLLLAGGWVAVGFQAKMLQSWLILPALGIGYLLAVGGPLRTRIVRVAIALVVTVLLSVAWITAIQATPAKDRPYIDGSTNNNAFSMVFGYNGVDRVLPGLIPGAVPQLAMGSGQTVATQNHTATNAAGHSPVKLVLPQFTTQIGWLYPAALGGIVLGLAPAIRRRRVVDRVEVGTVVALAVWLAVTGLVLSVAFVPHATYFATLALPLALLAVFGGMEAVRMSRLGARRAAVPLITLVSAESLWAVVVALSGPASMRWVAVPALLLGAGALAGILLRPLQRRFLVVAAAAALVGPVVWSACVIGPGGGGSASDAYAGPRTSAAVVHGAAAVRHPFATPPSPLLDPWQRALEHYLSARNHGRPWLFATDTMAIAVSFALYSNYEVMPMGGFSRQAPQPALSTL